VRAAGGGLAAHQALARRAEEVALEFDRRETLGPLGQVRHAGITSAGVGQGDHAGRMQEAVGRMHPGPDLELGAHPALGDLGHAQAEQAGQGALLARVHRIEVGIGSQHLRLPWRRRLRA
jgi:hypothetical protein